MRITRKGQVTIPQDIREQLGLRPGMEVDFEVDGDAARLTRSRATPTRGHRLIERMRGHGTVRMSTDEIMALTRVEGDEPQP